MPQSVTIRNLAQAGRIIKEMKLTGEDWDTEVHARGKDALKEALEAGMRDRIDRYLEEMERIGEDDRRNGTYPRHLLTGIGDILLAVPRTRRFSAMSEARAYARRVKDVDQMILGCFVFGLSTRKVAEALLPVLGERVSATTVSRIAATLDWSVAGFHRRPLKDRYRFLLLDGVVLKRRTGIGSVKRAVLVALGITSEGKKEVIDFYIAAGESQDCWEAFLNGLYRRGLTGEALELIVTDGGRGMLAALPLVYPRVAVQRCWVHKTRNVLNVVRVSDQKAVKRDIHRISHAKSLGKARKALAAFRRRWEGTYPGAVARLRTDEEALMAFFHIKDSTLWQTIRSTNAIERRFKEVRRRTRPMGAFSDRSSMDRILYAVFSHENWNQKNGRPFLALTQMS